MTDAKVLSIAKEYSEKAVAGVKPPTVTMETIVANRKLCAENTCGCYNAFCSCPPFSGTPEERLRILGKYSRSALIPVAFDADYRDRDAMKAAIVRTQETARAVMIRLKEAGIDCLALADGGCSYCPECAVKEGKKCRHPDMQIQSVSSNGVRVNEYLEASGYTPEFRDGYIEMYAVVLYN